MKGSGSKASGPSTPRQRCVKHKLDNVLGYLPDKQRDQVEPELKALFYRRTGKRRSKPGPPSAKSTAQCIRPLWIA